MVIKDGPISVVLYFESVLIYGHNINWTVKDTNSENIILRVPSTWK